MAHYDLGLVELRGGNVEAATAELRRAVALAPGYARARFALAEALIRAGQRADAARELDRTLADAADPDPARAGRRAAGGAALVRVLVVEDHLEIARAIATMLTRRNYAVTLAHEGPRGLELLREEAFDLAVVDIVLPGLDGFAVCREARRAGVETPVLMLTAREEVEDRVRGLDAGADDYLVKPFAEEELAARLRSLARRGRLPLRETIRIGEHDRSTPARARVSFRGTPGAAGARPSSGSSSCWPATAAWSSRATGSWTRCGGTASTARATSWTSTSARSGASCAPPGPRSAYGRSGGWATHSRADRAADALVRRRLRRRARRAVAGGVRVPGPRQPRSARAAAGHARGRGGLRRRAAPHRRWGSRPSTCRCWAWSRWPRTCWPGSRSARCEAARAREARFVADAAHELRTPLAAIATIAQAAPPSDDTAAIARIALAASALVSDLLTPGARRGGRGPGARAGRPGRASCAARGGRAERPRPSRGWTWTPAQEIYVLGEERRLHQLVANLLDNARRHARSAVRLRVFAEGDQAVVEVEDDGPGVDPADRERVFERFFSSRPHGEGSGLGLAIARWVARSHGGDVTIAERSRFVTRLPRYVPED